MSLTASMKYIFVVLISCALITSFGIHSFQLEHEHPGSAHGQTSQSSVKDLSGYLHAIEEKFFLLLLGFLVWAVKYLRSKIQNSLIPAIAGYVSNQRNTSSLHLRSKPLKPTRVCNYLEECFRSGILNPKLYS